MICERPVLIVEGDGDMAAVPILVRRAAQALDLHTFHPAPRPIKAGGLAKLRTAGTIERYVQYALRRDGDGALLVLDCDGDEDCAWKDAYNLSERCRGFCVQYEKRLGVVLMTQEFESIFLHDIRTIMQRCPEYDWDDNAIFLADVAEAVRGCKEKLGGVMRARKYKETQHQAKFASAVDIGYLRNVSRCVRHLVATLEWMAWEDTDEPVYGFKEVR